jgi:putative redox protein
MGQLRTRATHLQSQNTIFSDAPKDNQGKGEAFSPTDLVATALGSCMLTIMGIYANKHNINIEGTNIEITKYMGENPRRIVKIDVVINFPTNVSAELTEKHKASLLLSASTCPVAYSLHPDIEQDISVNFN